jgi:hypothetical protein
MGVAVMDVNHYTLEIMVRDRLAEMRALGEQSSQISAARPEYGRPRAALARALGRVAHLLRGGVVSARRAGDAGEVTDPGRRPKHGAVRG